MPENTMTETDLKVYAQEKVMEFVDLGVRHLLVEEMTCLSERNALLKQRNRVAKFLRFPEETMDEFLATDLTVGFPGLED